ncbi:tetratricopeptide repeat protein [Methanobrevibacter sp.]|uniref:tetratricopeptide repeat protein n=1 Tax=Methanobrevibacter sp. TaxID=66852 RepID=UPI00386EB9CB
MYEKIINEIKANLGQNNDLNRKYLSSQIDRYKDHPYSKEIIREISRMMWDCLTDEEKEEFIEISDRENPIIDILNEISGDIEMGDYETSLNKLKRFMNNFPGMFEDDKVSEYHSFTNPLEELIFMKYVGAEKQIRYIPDNKPLLDLYYIYGFLLFENQEFDEAEENLKKALQINPVSARIILELSEIYKMHTHSFNKFIIYTSDALKYAYYPQDMARCYRNLGYYYIEENQFDVATALLKYSMEYEMSIKAYTELQYIESKGHDINMTLNEAISILEDKNIQIGVNPFVLKTLEELSKEYEENKLYNQALYFYDLLYGITHDEKTLNKIDEIKEKVNN